MSRLPKRPVDFARDLSRRDQVGSGRQLSGFIRGRKKRPNGLCELLERSEIHLLLAIAQSLGGVWMHFDEQSVGAHGHRAAAECDHKIRPAAPLAGIHDDGEVGLFLGNGDRCQVKSVSRVSLEGPDAALAEQDVGISMCQDVFGGEQPFLDAFAHSALEQDGLSAPGRFDQKLEVLPVPRTDLKDVRDLRDVFHVALAEHLSNDFEAGFLAGKGKQPEALLTEALKLVRRRARLVSATAQNGGTRGLYRRGRAEKLLLALHRAGSGHEAKSFPAYFDACGIDDGIFWMRFPADQFVALLNAQHAFDLRQRGKRFEVGMRAFVTNRRHHCLGGPVDRGRRIAEFFDFGDDLGDLFF